MGNHLYILCGIPFSGKTSLAKRLVNKFGLTRIDLDEIKFEIFGQGINDSQIDQSGWNRVYQEMYQRIRLCLVKGETVVHDTGNFTESERNIVRKIADELSIETTTIFVDTPKEIAYQRLLENRKTKARFDVSDSGFENTVREMEPPKDDERHLVFNSSEDIESWIRDNFPHR